MNVIGNKAIISGISGYIGSNLARKLLDMGWEVGGIFKNSYEINAVNDIHDRIKFIVYENNVESLIEFFNNFHPACVFHLASCFIAEHQSHQVTDLIQSNLLFGSHVLEAMMKTGIKNFINTSTSWQHYKNEEYNPVCLYAATKEAFEKIIYFYVAAGDLRAINLELFDTYGPDDTRPKLINLFLKIIQSGEQLAMSGGEQEIDLVYIDDIIAAYNYAYQLLLQDDKAKVFVKYSVRTGLPMKVKDIAKVFEDVYGKKLNIVWGGRAYRKREVMKVWDGGIVLPNWKAQYSLEAGLKKIIL